MNRIYDNCFGQNKYSTVLRLAPWLMAITYFKEVNFIFLVVGHAQKADECLFNQNLYTFQDLVTLAHNFTVTSVTFVTLYACLT